MWHDNETIQDLIGFHRFADIIITLVSDKKILPITVGLFGDWGSGKSSVLRIIEEELKGRESILTLRFDGWLFEGYDDARAALMTTIVDHLEDYAKQNQTIWEKVEPRVNKLLKRIDWFRLVGLAAKGIMTFTSPEVQMAMAGLQLATTIGETGNGILKEEKAKQEGIYQSIRDFRTEFQTLIKESNISNLIVLIDDLDRCLPESIVTTLEAIKLFLFVPNTAFVIAADERIVRQAITRRYPPESYHEFDISQEYLDKLVQIPCILPPMSEIETETYIYLLFAEQRLSHENLTKLCEKARENRKSQKLQQPLNIGIAKSCIGEEAQKLGKDFELAARIAPILARNLEGNPRLVKRFLNTFALRIKLGENEGMEFEQGVLAKLMVIERFHKDLFKEIFKWQLDENGIPHLIEELEEFANGRKKKAEIQKGLDLTAWTENQDILEWLRLEPPLGGKNLAPYYHLAQESLRISIKSGRRLSQEQQELIVALQGDSKVNKKMAAEKLAAKQIEEIYPVIDALWERFNLNPKQSKALEGLFEVAYKHEGTARKLIDCFKNLSPEKIDASTVPKYAQIRQRHPGLKVEVNSQITKWSEEPQSYIARAAKAVLKDMPMEK